MPSDPIDNLRRLVQDLADNSIGTLDMTAIETMNFPALLTRIDRLQRIESAAKSLTDAWQRGDHEQAIIDAVAKLTTEVQSCDHPTT